MNYLGQWSNLELVRQDGTVRPAAEVLRDVRYVMFLFGASWVADCERLFPQIESFYEKHHLAKSFEIVYISRDYNRADMLRGFLTRERAAAAAARQQRRDLKEARQLAKQSRAGAADPRPSHSGSGSGGEPLRPADTIDAEKRRDTPPAEAAEQAGGAQESAADSSPPPLKRVAELDPVTSTSGFTGSLHAAAATNPLLSGSADMGGAAPHSGGFWAVPYDVVGVVGVPLLYHLRVFSYPGLVVCSNRPYCAPLPPQLLPTLPPPSQQSRVDPANAPRHYELTPRVAQAACYPEVLCTAGRFMIETRDPEGENFPWDRMSSQTRLAALVFLAIVGGVSAVVLTVVVPAYFRLRWAQKAAAAAARSL